MRRDNIRTEVDFKHFNERLKIEENMLGSDSDEKYVYKVSHKGVFYVLKGYQILIEHLIPGNKESVNLFKDGITAISEVFQEYYFGRIPSLFNPHFAKPLFLDHSIELAEEKLSASYMYIEIIFEYAGTGLNKLELVTFNDAYNLMRQSANALTFLHDMGSAFGVVTRKKVTATTRSFDGKMRSTRFEYSHLKY